MTRIRVPTEVLLSVSDQFGQASQQLGIINENLLRQIFTLLTQWDGQKMLVFQSEFKTAYEQMNVTIERMQVISQELKGIAVRFMDADQLQDFMGDQRMELFAKLSTISTPSEPPKSFIDQVGDTAKDLAGELNKGLGSVVESLKDTGTALVKNPIGTLGDMAYNATVGTVEDVIEGAAWGKDMVIDEAKREAFLEGIQEEANASGKANFVGEQAGVMLSSFLVGRLGIKGGPNHKPDTGGSGGRSKENTEGMGQAMSNMINDIRTKTPDQLLKEGWQDVTNPRKAQNTLSREYYSPETGVKISYDPGKKGATGFEAVDHYHIHNRSYTDKKVDYYFDIDGNPVGKGSKASHIVIKDGE